jgi:hypothetical protein
MLLLTGWYSSRFWIRRKAKGARAGLLLLKGASMRALDLWRYKLMRIS